jgi:hypothetical protein
VQKVMSFLVPQKAGIFISKRRTVMLSIELISMDVFSVITSYGYFI